MNFKEQIDVGLRLTENMLGTVPMDKEIYETFIRGKTPIPDPLPADYETEAENIEEIEAKGWTGFMKDEKGLFIFDYGIRGFLKNAALVLRDTTKLKNGRSKIDNLVFVFPRRIYLGKEKPDGVLERPIRAMTPQGPRVSLIRSDYVLAGTAIEFEIRIVEHKDKDRTIDSTLIHELLEYGTLCGLGQFRSGSYGRFVVEKWEVKKGTL